MDELVMLRLHFRNCRSHRGNGFRRSSNGLGFHILVETKPLD